MYWQYSYSAEQDDPAWRTSHKKLEGNTKSTSHPLALAAIFSRHRLFLFDFQCLCLKHLEPFTVEWRFLEPPRCEVFPCQFFHNTDFIFILYLWYMVSIWYGAYFQTTHLGAKSSHGRPSPWFSPKSQEGERSQSILFAFWQIWLIAMFVGPIDNVLICF